MVRTDRVALLVLLLVILFSWATVAFQPYEIDPRALGRGTAYTAVADGSLAPLWNPGGGAAAPGVHGAFAVGISPNGASTLLLGASIAAANSPTVIWNMVRSGGVGEILGTFAFPLFPQTGLGCGLSYRFSDAPGGISFHVGFRHCGPQWAFGVSLSHLGARDLRCGSSSLPPRWGSAHHRPRPVISRSEDRHRRIGTGLGGRDPLGNRDPPRWRDRPARHWSRFHPVRSPD